MKKDYNTAVPIRRAMLCHMDNTTIIVQLLEGVCNVSMVAMALIQCF